MKPTTVLRWAATLPAAILGGVIASLVGNILAVVSNWFYYDTNHSIAAKWACDLASGIGLGVGYIQSGAYTAPSHKPHAKFFLGIFGIILTLAGIAVFGYNHQWASLITIVIFGCACVVGMGKPSEVFKPDPEALQRYKLPSGEPAEGIMLVDPPSE